MSDWPFGEATDLAPHAYLSGIGAIFATFDARTQDSGNISYGLEADGRRWFVKTAGDPTDPAPFLPHGARVELLANTQRVAAALAHPALPRLHGVIQSAWGPMLAYDWVPGELLGGRAERRADPASAHQRFRRLPSRELTGAIDAVIDVHEQLCGAGWVACDFYDGSVIYDFDSRQPWLVDLDSYHMGPFTNDMGRMFGSERFMAPEEFELGALIDQRTTVFTLGRFISNFMGDGTLDRTAFRGADGQFQAMTAACAPDPSARLPSVAALADAWRS